MAYRVPIGYFDEGEQAEAYKARKAEEAAKKKEDSIKAMTRGAGAGNSTSDPRYKEAKNKEFEHNKKTDGNVISRTIANNKARKEFNKNVDEHIDKTNDKDNDRRMKSVAAVDKEMAKRRNAGEKHSASEKFSAYDAVNRHMRRHPEQYKECGIFESVTFLID